MRIFITGATGFLGSYLVEDLLKRGHEIAVLLRSASNDWRIREFRPAVNIIAGSLDALPDIRSPLQAFRPEAVIHMAWRGVGNVDRNSPIQARNVADGVELVAMAADVGARIFVGAGSQAEYGPCNRPLSESEIPRPTTLYGKAKLAAGSMMAQLAAERGMRFAWMRIFSTYGPKDAEHWLIPTLIKTLRAGERMPLTRCEQRWGFLHARDAAAAFRTVIENESAEGIFNVGSPDAPPLRDTVTLLRDLIDPAAELGIGEIPYRPDQVMILQADIERLSRLGWRPKISLDAGLRETVEWYATAQ